MVLAGIDGAAALHLGDPPLGHPPVVAFSRCTSEACGKYAVA
jgi:hypothetical protein